MTHLEMYDGDKLVKAFPPLTEIITISYDQDSPCDKSLAIIPGEKGCGIVYFNDAGIASRFSKVRINDYDSIGKQETLTKEDPIREFMRTMSDGSKCRIRVIYEP